jgi:hypothetical protein
MSADRRAGADRRRHQTFSAAAVKRRDVDRPQPAAATPYDGRHSRARIQALGRGNLREP